MIGEKKMELIAIDFESAEEERTYLESLILWLEDKIADPNCLDDKRKLRGWLNRARKELKEKMTNKEWG